MEFLDYTGNNETVSSLRLTEALEYEAFEWFSVAKHLGVTF